MKWFGVITIFLTALLGTNLLKDFFRLWFPGLKGWHFDIVVAVLCILALVNYFYAQGRIKSLTGKIDLLEYQDIATYSATGNKSAKVNGVPIVTTPIVDWSKDFVERQDDKIDATCSSLAIKKCESVIQKLPSYPFGYYFLALCQKQNHNPEWKQNALKAKLILDNTTRIPGHHPDHDWVLTDVTRMLQDKEMGRT
jgi:hypothetical protein